MIGPEADALPLTGLTVVEITTIESVAYAGMLLAQFGADVVKIEGPAGDPLRKAPPLLSRPGADPASVPFEFLNAGKSSLVADQGNAALMAALSARLSSADVILADHLALSGLGLEVPERANGQLHVLVGPYGGDPADAVNSSPLTRLHAGTSGYIIPADIDMTARPGWPGPYAFEAIHGVGIALSVIAERSRADGGVVDYSLQAYGIWLEKLLYSRTSVRGIDFHRNTAVYPYGGNIACSDGYVAIFVIEERQWRGFCAMIGRPEWLDDSRFADGVLRSTNRAPIGAELVRWCAAHTVDEVIRAGADCDVPVGRVRRPEDVLTSDVLLDRKFFERRETAFGPVDVPALPMGPAMRGRAGVPSPPLGGRH